MIALKNYIADIPDFPEPGILFRDISPLLSHVEARDTLVDAFGDIISELQPNILAGLDARGFIIASLLAQKYDLPLMMIRKKGKLPGEVISQNYDLEYGSNVIEIQKHTLDAKHKVLLVDDLLATGGTLRAAIDLILQTSATLVGCACAIELCDLGGREKLGDIPFYSLIRY